MPRPRRSAPATARCSKPSAPTSSATCLAPPSPRTKPIARPISPSISARTCRRSARRGRRHRRHLHPPRRHRQGLLHPRQRLVRRLRQADDEPQDAAGRVRFRRRRHNDQVVYVGDSPNDAPMFAHFANAVGVANVLRFRNQLASPPDGSPAAKARGDLRSWRPSFSKRGKIPLLLRHNMLTATK